MKYLKILTIILVFVSFLGNQGCRDCEDPTNPDCSNYDPCYGVFETNADFGFFQKDFGGSHKEYWFDITDDTMFTSTGWGDPKIYFRAKYSEMDSFHWQVGADPRVFTDSVFFLYLGGNIGTIETKLITYHTPNTTCFPNDIGTDTVIRNLNIVYVDSTHDIPLCNCRYHGIVDGNTDDSITVDLNKFSDEIAGLPIPCDSVLPYVRSSWEILYDPNQYSPTCKPNFHGKVLPDRKTLVLDLSYENEQGRRVEKRFVGVKE